MESCEGNFESVDAAEWGDFGDMVVLFEVAWWALVSVYGGRSPVALWKGGISMT